MPYEDGGFPAATLLENVVGSFLLGVLVAIIDQSPGAHDYWRPLIGTGLLGGFTTFSAYTSHTVTLLRADHPVIGPLYKACRGRCWSGRPRLCRG